MMLLSSLKIGLKHPFHHLSLFVTTPFILSVIFSSRCFAAEATAEVKLGVKFNDNPNLELRLFNGQITYAESGFGAHEENGGGEVTSSGLLYQQNYFASSYATSPPTSQSLATSRGPLGIFATVENTFSSIQTVSGTAFWDFFGIASAIPEREVAGFRYGFEANGGTYEAGDEGVVTTINLFKFSDTKVAPPNVTFGFAGQKDFSFEISPNDKFGFTINQSLIDVYARSTAVPEPSIMLGTLSAIGFGTFFKRKYRNSQSGLLNKNKYLDENKPYDEVSRGARSGGEGLQPIYIS